MWQQLGLDITNLERRPGRGESVAAAFRQLLRAYDADDAVAAWSATGAVCTRLRFLIGDHLAREESWDSKGRWHVDFAENTVLYRCPSRVRVATAMIWGLRDGDDRSQWAEPFDAELDFAPDLSDLATYAIRFGDRRTFPGEGFQDSLARIATDAEIGRIAWKFSWTGRETRP